MMQIMLMYVVGYASSANKTASTTGHSKDGANIAEVHGLWIVLVKRTIHQRYEKCDKSMQP
jgi:hypothetical protein